MSFQDNTCPNCHSTYEYYQRWTIVAPCPYCGGGVHGPYPLTRDEYYKAMGVPIIGQCLTINQNGCIIDTSQHTKETKCPTLA